MDQWYDFHEFGCHLGNVGYVEAMKWSRLAAEQGNVGAQFLLGYSYRNGEGVTQDDAEAVKWYRLAAEQGDALSQFSLGHMYLNGDGVIQDTVSAHMWFNIAASSGDSTGKANRDVIAKDMTPAQIAEAQKLARDWITEHPSQ